MIKIVNVCEDDSSLLQTYLPALDVVPDAAHVELLPTQVTRSLSSKRSGGCVSKTRAFRGKLDREKLQQAIRFAQRAEARHRAAALGKQMAQETGTATAVAEIEAILGM